MSLTLPVTRLLTGVCRIPFWNQDKIIFYDRFPILPLKYTQPSPYTWAKIRGSEAHCFSTPSVFLQAKVYIPNARTMAVEAVLCTVSETRSCAAHRFCRGLHQLRNRHK